MDNIREYVHLLAESLWYHEEYRSEEDIEQHRGKYASLREPLFHLEPLQASAVIIPYTASQTIVELAEHFYRLRWNSKANEHLPKKCAVDRVVCLLQVDYNACSLAATSEACIRNEQVTPPELHRPCSSHVKVHMQVYNRYTCTRTSSSVHVY